MAYEKLGLTFDNKSDAIKFFKAMEIPGKRYRMLHSYSKQQGDPCYLPKHSGIITPDKSKAKVWKTFQGALKALRDRYFSAGYELESFEPEQKAPVSK